jgi:hypothetical protein
MTPNQKKSEPGSPGFVGRNWMGLALMLCFALFSMLDVIATFEGSQRTISLYVRDGKMGVTSFGYESAVTPTTDFRIRADFHAPAFSSRARFFGHSNSFTADMPLWTLLALCAVWIVFREWGRGGTMNRKAPAAAGG